MDRLSPFFDHFALSARVFYSGHLCGTSGDHESQLSGHLHVLRRGSLEVTDSGGRTRAISQPAVLFYPRPFRHRFHADEKTSAEIVCATIQFGAGMLNPLMRALPEVLIVPLATMPELAPTVDLLFAEAFAQNPGRQTAVDRLAEYFLVLLLRAAMNAQLIDTGVLNGLADPRLAGAITAIHADPARAWTLAELAAQAKMSRARFAVHFRKTVGTTPFDYLTDWRIGVAQTLLKQGKPLKIVAPTVGYTNPTALTKAFNHRIGVSPTAWLARNAVAANA